MKIVNSHKTIAQTDNNNDKMPNDTKQIILKLCAAFTHVLFFFFSICFVGIVIRRCRRQRWTKNDGVRRRWPEYTTE